MGKLGIKHIGPVACSATALLLLCSAQAMAEPGKLLTPYVDLTYSHDSNVFRTADDAVLDGDQTRADSSVRAVVGLALDKEISRQKFTARAGLSQSKYRHFKLLDYDSRDLQANFNWRVGSNFRGNLGGSTAKTLTPYTEFREIKRNLRLQKSENADAVWLVSPSWRLRTNLTRNEQEYDLDSQKYKNHTQTTAEIGLDYLSSSGNQIGIIARKGKEIYPFAEVFGTINVINNQRTEELKLRLDWRMSGKTQLQVVTGVVKHKHDVLPIRDFSGIVGRVTLNWYPTAKTELATFVWHEVDAVDNLTTNYSVSNGLRFAPAMSISSKLRVEGVLRFEKRVPVGITGVNLSQVDKFFTASISLTYVPIARMQLVTTLSRDTLNSNLALRSFHANAISFNAHYEY